MKSLGADSDVIELCLNHIEQNRMKRIYQRHEHETENSEAWRLLGERLTLLRSNAKNVVTLKGKKKAA